MFWILTCTFFVLAVESTESYKCFLEQNVSNECLLSLDPEEIFAQSSEIGSLACMILRGANKFQKAQQMCLRATSYNIERGYDLFQVYLKIGKVKQMLELQYQLFFSNPFHHEEKINEALRQLKGDLLQWEKKVQGFEKVIVEAYLGNHQEALALMDAEEKVHQEEQDVFENLLRLRLLERSNSFLDALNLVDSLIKNNSGDKLDWFFYHLKGNFLMHHLKFSEAIKSFEKAIEENQQFQFVFDWYNSGLCLQKMRQFGRSLSYLKKAVMIAPHSAEALNALGFTFSSLGGKDNNEVAESYYKKAIEAEPEYYVTFFNYGVLLSERNQFQKSIMMFEKALEIKTDFISAEYGKFESLYQMDKEKGLTYMKKLKQMSHSDGVELARLLYKFNQYELSKKYLSEHLNSSSRQAQVREWLGMAQFSLDNIKEAKEAFKKSIQLGNTKPYMWFNLGYCQQLLKEFEEALKSYQISLSLDPSSPARDRIQQLQKPEQL